MLDPWNVLLQNRTARYPQTLHLALEARCSKIKYIISVEDPKPGGQTRTYRGKHSGQRILLSRFGDKIHQVLIQSLERVAIDPELIGLAADANFQLLTALRHDDIPKRFRESVYGIPRGDKCERI